MKKIKLMSLILMLFSINIYAQEDTDEFMNELSNVTNSTSSMVSAFKNSKKFVDFGMTMQKAIDLQRNEIFSIIFSIKQLAGTRDADLHEPPLYTLIQQVNLETTIKGGIFP